MQFLVPYLSPRNATFRGVRVGNKFGVDYLKI